MTVPMQGEVAPGWEPVREAFAQNWAEGRELGAGVAVYHRGRKVVDLTGGWFDADRSSPYTPESLQLVFSTTKGMAAACVAMCVERGLLDPAAPVAGCWPEFAAEGKGRVTVAELMAHRAGLITVEPPLTLEQCLDWDTVVAALAAQRPFWEPGTTHGYHALTYGWLAGELVRRVDPAHRSLGRFFTEEVAAPLGLECWIGLPAELEPRVSRLVNGPPPPPEALELMAMVMGPQTNGGRALSMSGAFALGGGESPWNRPDVHRAEIPAANGITNAASLARMYAALIGEVDGCRLLAPETVELARRPVSQGPDACLLVETAFGLGFMLEAPFTPMAGPGSFGHPGAGGSIGLAHPELGLAFGYVMNQMDANLAGDVRAARLIDAAVTCARTG